VLTFNFIKILLSNKSTSEGIMRSYLGLLLGLFLFAQLTCDDSCIDCYNYPEFVDLEVLGFLPADSAFKDYELDYTGVKYLVISLDDTYDYELIKDIHHTELTIQPNTKDFTTTFTHIKNHDYTVNVIMLNSNRDTLFVVSEYYSFESGPDVHFNLTQPYAILTPQFTAVNFQISDHIGSRIPLKLKYSCAGITGYSNLIIEPKNYWLEISNVICSQYEGYYRSEFTIYATLDAVSLPVGLSTGLIDIYLNRPFRDTITVPITVNKSSEWGIIKAFGHDSTRAYSPVFSPKGTFLFVKGKENNLIFTNIWQPAYQYQASICNDYQYSNNKNPMFSLDENWLISPESPNSGWGNSCLCFSNMITLSKHEASICSSSSLDNAILSPDNKLIAVSSPQYSMLIYNFETGKIFKKYEDEAWHCVNYNWSPDMKYFFGLSGWKLIIFDGSTYSVIKTVDVCATAGDILVLPEKNLIYCGAGKVSYDTFEYLGCSKIIQAISSDLNDIIIFSNDLDSILIVSINDNRIINSIFSPCYPMNAVSWMHNSNIIATSDGNYVYVWDIGTLVQ
jgi:hypothetical protein